MDSASESSVDELRLAEEQDAWEWEEAGESSTLLVAERSWPNAETASSHEQCADSLASLGGTRLLLSRARRLCVFDTALGATLALSVELPFDVYSADCEQNTGYVAACGCVRTDDNANVALLRLVEVEDGKLQLRLLLAFGLDPPLRAPRMPRLQANGVRFGWALVAAPPSDAASPAFVRSRVLLVGSQDKCVYCLAMPPKEAAGRLEGRLLTVDSYRTAINCCASSPDGRFLAAVGDREEVYLRGGAQGWMGAGSASRTLTLSDVPREVHRPAGCQYVGWSDDSSRLAASSDTLNAVAVWALPPSDEPPVPLARLADFDLPLLSLVFLSGSHTLVFAEKEGCLYAVDVDAAGEMDGWRRPLSALLGGRCLRSMGVQRLAMEPPEAPRMLWQAAAVRRSRRITGLARAADGWVYATLPLGLYSFSPLTSWTQASHTLFPPRFRDAVRLLLTAQAAAPPAEDSPSCPLASLPQDLLLIIISLAAMPQGAWLPARPSAEEESERIALRLQQASDEDFDEADE